MLDNYESVKNVYVQMKGYLSCLSEIIMFSFLFTRFHDTLINFTW